MRSREVRWTNQSVLRLAAGEDPVEAVTRRARDVVIRALDDGWAGPPFEPLELAEKLGIVVAAIDEVRDARLVAYGASRLRIEFNPNRSRRRVRYSIAHEIGHTLFPDCADEIRHRESADERGIGHEWQLEALCNIAAAEILMPMGTLPALSAGEVGLDRLIELREKYDVSTEATFIRFVRVTDEPCAMFCASRVGHPGPTARHRIDYMIGSSTWPFPVHGCEMPASGSVASHCTSIDFSWKGEEIWRIPKKRLRVECVGIPPYPGSGYPRIVGIAMPTARTGRTATPVLTVAGDATRPRGSGPKVIVHVVNDKTPNWGGRGFARALGRRYPEVQQGFKEWAGARRLGDALGEVHFHAVSEDLYVASMISQHGYGPSPKPRLRYVALRQCLQHVAEFAGEKRMSVHMPRIGTGEAGGAWEIVEELVCSTVSAAGVPVTVYDRPGSPWRPSAQGTIGFGKR